MLKIPQYYYEKIVWWGWELLEKLTTLPKFHNDKEYRLKMMQKFYKAAFVRHPFARLVSAYRNKVIDLQLMTSVLKRFKSATPVSNFCILKF